VASSEVVEDAVGQVASDVGSFALGQQLHWDLLDCLPGDARVVRLSIERDRFEVVVQRIPATVVSWRPKNSYTSMRD
jgi:hypothetical protein